MLFRRKNKIPCQSSKTSKAKKSKPLTAIIFYVGLLNFLSSFALKMLRNSIVSENEMKDYLKEIDYLKEFRNQHLVKYVENFLENQRPCIVTMFYKVKFGLFELKKKLN